MGFTARTSAPSTSDKHWVHTSAGGLNECIKVSGNSCIPNCVGYAWGRFYEILGKRPSLSRSNAENWYSNTSDGYSRGKTAKLGAVVCWAKGKAGNSSDGAGHVAIVEKIKSDGSFVVSQSGYKSKRFWTSTIPASGKLSGYTFQGFIYNPAVSTSSSSSSASPSTGYVVGKTYTLQSTMNVRTGPGTNYAKKKKSALTANAQAHATSGGALKKGTKVTCKGVYKNGSAIWLLIPSGYVCAKGKSGTVYIK